MKLKTLAVLTALTLSPLAANAGTTGQRSIVNYGCHTGGNTVCYVEISGAAVSGGSCTSNSVRWDTSTQAGRSWLMLISSAAIANKQISLHISGCLPNQPAYPTFSYGHVYP